MKKIHPLLLSNEKNQYILPRFFKMCYTEIVFEKQTAKLDISRKIV